MSYIKTYDDISDNIEYWNVSVILTQYKNINIDVPYQRNTIWTLKQKQYFIDSIINGFSVFPIVLNVVNEKKYQNSYSGGYKWNCVDGKQRLSSIWEFAQGNFTVNVKLENGNIISAYYNDIKSKFDDERPMPIRIYKGLDKSGECGVFDRLQNGLSCTKGERINAIESKFITFIKTKIVDKYKSILTVLRNEPSDKRKNNLKKWIEFFAVCIDKNKHSWTMEQIKSYCDKKMDENEYKKFTDTLDFLLSNLNIAKFKKNKISTSTLELCMIRATFEVPTDDKLIEILEKRVFDLDLSGNGWNKIKKENFNSLLVETNKYDCHLDQDKLHKLIINGNTDNYLKEINTIDLNKIDI